ncbi:hypothetical protein [Bacillus marinisedimentorum]|uniref:hypothetical protein n=1 Tax=Bacillus marinisedimentorum TaxID=1821260 RepID=UPI0007E0A55F|nr:hypothetical protein [Bacillus marinisedimentorum]
MTGNYSHGHACPALEQSGTYYFGKLADLTTGSQYRSHRKPAVIKKALLYDEVDFARLGKPLENCSGFSSCGDDFRILFKSTSSGRGRKSETL